MLQRVARGAVSQSASLDMSVCSSLTDKNLGAVESRRIAGGGDVKRAKIGARRLVVQSRTIERYLQPCQARGHSDDFIG